MNHDDLLTPHWCIFARLRQTTRHVSQVYEEALRPVGLKGTQFTLLMALIEVEEMNILALAASLDLDRTTLTRNLKPLEKQGCLRVGPDSQDRRIRKVQLTPQGRRLLEEAQPLWQAAQSQILKQLGTDTQHLLALLEKTRLL